MRYPENLRKYAITLLLLLFLSGTISHISCSQSGLFQQAKENANAANEGFRRSLNFVNDWLQYADSESGLIPRNLYEDDDIWNARDSAADNYPFMVLTTYLLDRDLFDGHMRDMLSAEKRVTPRIGVLPDTYSFTKNGFHESEIDSGSIIFGSSEYVKDGLLPLTEYLGRSPWSDRMISILDDIWKYAPVATSYGNIPSENPEINGELLQTLSRIYWMTGEEKYLNYAVRLGDYYLLGGHHPTEDFTSLRLRDHGCEIVSGLCELYATLHYADPAKKAEYRESIHTMLEDILEVGRNEHGLFYNTVNPQTGEILNEGVADTWGYTYNGFYAVYLIDGTETYRQALLQAFENLEHYEHYNWESGSADGDADAIESALNLYNREQQQDVARWIDSEIKFMWEKQDDSPRDEEGRWHDSGVIEGWHGDGNFARTTIMYCLWKTQGVTGQPWRNDLQVGSVYDDGELYIYLSAEKDWNGKIYFDLSRHQTILNLPIDWPRINQFPEWFTLQEARLYQVTDIKNNESHQIPGHELKNGYAVELKPGQEVFFSVK
jgi:hypothetical protein